MESIDKKKKIINYLMGNGILVSEDTLNLFSDGVFVNKICDQIDSGSDFKLILNDLEIHRQESIRNKNNQESNSTSSLEKKLDTPQDSEILKNLNNVENSFFSDIKITSKNAPLPQKREVEDFVSYFSARYKQFETLLKQRKELSNILSISRLKTKKDRDTVAIIGIVRSKDITKNNNIILTLEDLTGEIKVLINKNNQQIFDIGKNIVEDEVIGIVGVNGDNILFSNSVIQPDIPLDKEFKKFDKEDYMVFLSDIHVGSRYFLKKEFNKFLSWIRLESGNEKQKEIAKKVKYIFIAGDIVDGVGIYPNQENELEIQDIHEQYKEAANLLSKIPKHIKIIIGPGNHDAVRMAEPQPALSRRYASALYDVDNIMNVPNPCFLNLGATQSFPGFDILLYHGFSFDHYVANVDAIRQAGGYDKADMIMKFLLKRRHLAPTYKSTLFIPESNYDGLAIDKIPDFFITGHIHKTAVRNYRNITLISGSCWQAKTSFQEKVGHNPEPARVPIVNLKTRQVKILNFEL